MNAALGFWGVSLALKLIAGGLMRTREVTGPLTRPRSGSGVFPEEFLTYTDVHEGELALVRISLFFSLWQAR